jgi:hypothetical protein
MKIVLANSQMFQALYIDTDAEKNEDKIVLIEEMVESLPEAQQILTTAMKEPYYGMVIAGSNIAITKFRSKIYDLDKKENLGKEEIGEMLAQIADVAFDQKCEVVFFKGPIEHKGVPQAMKNVSVALDLKSIFDPAKIKSAGKDFWNNLIGVNKDLEKQYEELDLKKHAELMDYLKRNESSIEKLNKAIKEKSVNLPNVEKMLHELDTDMDITEYLGADYENLKYYYISLDDLYNNSKLQRPKDEEPEEDDDLGFEKTINPAQDPRQFVKGIITTIPNVNGRIMDKGNVADVGMDETHVLVALKKPDSFDMPYWPKAPIKRPTLDLIKQMHWLKDPNQKKKKK